MPAHHPYLYWCMSMMQAALPIDEEICHAPVEGNECISAACLAGLDHMRKESLGRAHGGLHVKSLNAKTHVG